MRSMLFRRLLLASMARSFAADALRTAKARSRRDHAQNAAAAIIDLWSELAWRPDPISRFLFTRGERMRSELRYAMRELQLAVHPKRKRWSTQRLIALAVPSAAAAVAVAVRARSGSEAGESRT